MNDREGIAMSASKVDPNRRKLEDKAYPGYMAAVEGLSDYLSIMNLLSKSMNNVLAEKCSLTAMQYRMILRLLCAPGNTLRITDLAATLRAGVSTVSAATPKLVEEGFVTRSEDPDDMRVVSLTLTKRGASLIEKADFHVDSFLKGYWSNLTPEQLDTALSSSMNAVTLHNVRRIEEGKVRLDTAFFDTVMISRTLTAQRLGEHGLRTSEFRVLLALYLLGPSATASHIADYLFLKSSDVTTPIKALEAKGLITKERSADNRRTKPLALTDAGLEKTEGLLPYVYDALVETCHSDEAAVQVHLSTAQNVVSRERGTALFS